MSNTLRNMTRDLRREFIGFEPLLDELFSNFTLDRNGNFQTQTQANKYPPYNLLKRDEDNYEISLAVAGFSEDELDVTVDGNTLTIEGAKDQDQAVNGEYLYRGIASRAFKQTFRLGEFIEIGDVALKDGILNVYLYRHVPENMKPKKIEVKRV